MTVMAENNPIGNQPENLIFWFRPVTHEQLNRIRDCHSKGAVLPVARSGLSQSVAALLAREAGMPSPGEGKGVRGTDRSAVLDAMNRKFNLLLEHVYPPQSVLSRAPVMLEPEGRGGVVWLKNAPFAENDVLELRFLVSARLPWLFHGYARVVRMRKDWSTRGTRVEFRFETGRATHEDANLVPNAPSPPEPTLTVPAQTPVPQPRATFSPSSLPPVPTAQKQPLPELTTIQKKKPIVEKKIQKTVPQNQPSLVVDADGKYEHMLQEGLKMSQLAVEDAVVNKGEDPHLRFQPQADQRRDFRINDRIPFVWCHVSDTALQEAMVTFHKDKAFGLRTIIRNQQKILAILSDIQEQLKRKHSKARKNVDWHRDRLSWLFLRAASENDENYFLGMTELFAAIARDISKQAGGSGGQWSIQVLSLLRHMMELRQVRDQSNPVTEANALKKANASLEDVERQLPKALQKVEENEPALAAKLKMYMEAIATIDLTQHDRPVGQSPDGKDLFTVNLSATGLAFRTRRLWVKKGDILEMRIFLSTGGDRFDPVTTYGRVVFVNEPVDNKIKVATYIDPKPLVFEQKIYLHIARRQRELLSDRSLTKDADDF